MAAITITKENFDDTITNNDIVILDFWASWCSPCLGFAPVFEEASNKFPNIIFGKINTEEQKELAQSFQVRSIPMISVFREQIMLFHNPGALPAEALNELIEHIQSLDMDDIRKQIEEQKTNN
jgi:thioredoxin 1